MLEIFLSWGGGGGAVEFIFILRSEAVSLLCSSLAGKRERCWLNARTKLVCLHAGWSGILLCFMYYNAPCLIVRGVHNECCHQSVVDSSPYSQPHDIKASLTFVAV